MPNFIFIQQISVLNILNMLYNLHFFFSKCRLFHNGTLFGFCITHILNTGCAKTWKIIRRQKVKCTYTVSYFAFWQTDMNTYVNVFPSLIISRTNSWSWCNILIMRCQSPDNALRSMLQHSCYNLCTEICLPLSVLVIAFHFTAVALRTVWMEIKFDNIVNHTNLKLN